MIDQILVLLLDQRSRVLWSSRDPFDRFGWQGASVIDEVDERDRHQVERHLANCLLRRQTVEYVARGPRSDGPRGTGDAAFHVLLLPVDAHPVAIVALCSTLPSEHDRFGPLDRQLLELLAADQTLAMIAQQLGLSRTTLNRHIRRLKDALGVDSLHGLIYRAAHSGLIRTNRGPRL